MVLSSRSPWSLLCWRSVGSVLSIGSSGSILSIGAAGAVRGRRNGGAPDPATVGTVLALLALLRSAADR
jgi:hypothetical protein